MNHTEYAISISGLGKSFGEVKALDDVSLNIRRGEVFGILGPDGAGKTTLMRILAGVMSVDSGKVSILGNDIVANIEAAKPYTGYLSQKFSLYPDLTVAENIDFYSRIFGVSTADREMRKERLLEFSNLEPYADRQAKNLSGGMKQKLALSCALIHTPKILLLDEPSTGVDPISRREFWKILYDLLTDGVTIVFATPYMDEAERAGNVTLLHNGKVLKCDSPGNLKQAYSFHLAELITSDNRRARDCLKRLYDENDVVFFGDKLHIKVDDFRRQRSSIENAMADFGIQVTSLNQIPPGMEDVFIDAIS